MIIVVFKITDETSGTTFIFIALSAYLLCYALIF